MGDGTSSMLLEDALGPSERRYFSAGYKEVRHLVFPSSRDSTGDGVAAWSGRVVYPPKWSLNDDGTSRSPHLSSVDAIVLPLLALEQQHQGLQMATQLQKHWVRRLELRGGSQPWTDLAHVPLTFAALPEVALQESCDIQAVVGNIRVTLGLANGTIPELNRKTARCKMSRESLYGGGFWPAASRDVIKSFDEGTHSLRSAHELTYGDIARERPSGLESAFWPAPSAIEYLVTMGQLTQALIHRSFRTTRTELGNLWMRRMRISIPSEPTNRLVCYQAVTSINRDSVITIGSKQVRKIRVTSRTSDGVEAEASLAFTVGPVEKPER